MKKAAGEGAGHGMTLVGGARYIGSANLLGSRYVKFKDVFVHTFLILS